MSDETFDAVEEALRAHMADEHDGALLNHWMIVAHGISATTANYSHYQYMNHAGPPHEWLGLLSMVNERVRNHGPEDDDE